MKLTFNKIDAKYVQIFRFIGREAQRQGVSAYLVGGFVRDVLLHHSCGDIDIMVEGRAADFIKVLKGKRIQDVKLHPKFGTASVKFSGDVRIDFASARAEEYSRPGALPDVRPGSLEDDILRRDFTINTLAVRLNPKEFGEVVDLFDGVKDLREKKIKVLHKNSFRDDPTRILRAVRYEQRLRFKIDVSSVRLIKAAVRSKCFDDITPVRYFNELKKILLEDRPKRYLLRLKEFSSHQIKIASVLLTCIEKGIAELKKQEGLAGFDRWWFIYYLGCLPPSEKRALTIAKDFQLGREERKAVADTFELQKKRRIFEKLTSGEICLALRDYHLTAIIFLYCSETSKKIKTKIKRYLHNDRTVKLRISGRDVQQLGVPRGEKIQSLLNAILVAKVNQGLQTRKEELAFANRLWAKIEH